MKNDNELKLALAKLLPEKIGIFAEGLDQYQRIFWWHKTDTDKSHAATVLETEWLHVVWLIEETMKLHVLFGAYYSFLSDETTGKLLHASWQQRATAILKTKGLYE